MKKDDHLVVFFHVWGEIRTPAQFRQSRNWRRVRRSAANYLKAYFPDNEQAKE